MAIRIRVCGPCAFLNAPRGWQSVRKSDVEELRGLHKPPLQLLRVMEAVCVLFRVKPVMKADSDGQSQPDYWEAAQRTFLADAKGLIRGMLEYDRSKVSLKLLELLSPIVDDADFTVPVLERINRTAAVFCQWVRAVVNYGAVAARVEPMRRALLEAQGVLDVAKSKLSDRKRLLADASAKLKALRSSHAARVARGGEIARTEALYGNRLGAAERVLAAFTGQRAAFGAAAAEVERDIERAAGDALVGAAGVTYAAQYAAGERARLYARWVAIAGANALPVTPDATLHLVLRNAQREREWRMCGMGDDAGSAENMLCVEHCGLVPLLVDPDAVGADVLASWAREMAVPFDSVRLSSPTLLQSVAGAVATGKWVLITGVATPFDAGLSALLSVAVAKGGDLVTVGTDEVTMHPGFRLILASSSLSVALDAYMWSSRVAAIDFRMTRDVCVHKLVTGALRIRIPSADERRSFHLLAHVQHTADVEKVCAARPLLPDAATAGGGGAAKMRRCARAG